MQVLLIKKLRRKDKGFQKGTFAMTFGAGCDNDSRFIVETANHFGSTNDIVTQQDTHLKQVVKVEKKSPPKYFFIVYEVFTNTNYILTPWPSR